MSTQTTLTLKQGDSDTLVETIEGLDSLIGYNAKLYIKTKDGVEVDTLTGVIDGLEITYEILNEDSKSYPIGNHSFETKIWDSSDHVYTPSYGKFSVKTALENDPS